MRQNAMLMVLSDKVANNRFIIVDKLEMAEYKTKVFNQIINGFASKIFTDLKVAQAKTEKKSGKPSFLIIVDQGDDKLNYSARNLAGVELSNIDNINIVELLKYKNLIITRAGVEKLEKRYNK